MWGKIWNDNWLSLANALPILIVALGIFVLFRARRQPLWKEAYRRLGKNRLALVAIGIISLYIGIAVIDSIGGKDSPTAERMTLLDRAWKDVPVERTYSAPMATMTTGEPSPKPLKGRHLLGTDGGGKDVIMQAMKGCRTALFIGFFTTLTATPLALLFGLMAGYYGKRVDDGIQYLYTLLASIPNILLLICILMLLGRGLDKMVIALAVTSWIGLCRLSRGETLKHRDREYVRAARALGISDFRIMTRHILPNLLPVVIISVTLSLSQLILAESILSYLGLGVESTTGSWGNMIDQARLELARSPILWWNLAGAFVALFTLVFSFNILGDALRDAIDPRLRSS